MKNTEKAEEKLLELVNMILGSKPEELSGTLNKVLFTGNLPMSKWSFANRFLAVIQGATDARSYYTWPKAKRNVKKGAKAIFILAPCLISKNQKCECGGIGSCEKCDGKGYRKHQILVGFRSQAEFDVSQTEGEPLPRPPELPEPPLLDVANKLGVEVTVVFSERGEYGSYSRANQKIELCTDSEQTFFHELSHAVDAVLPGKKDEHDFNEIVAELSACFLASMYGHAANVVYTQNYCKVWSNGNLGVQLMKALDRVNEIYSYIAEAHRGINPMMSKMEERMT